MFICYIQKSKIFKSTQLSPNTANVHRSERDTAHFKVRILCCKNYSLHSVNDVILNVSKLAEKKNEEKHRLCSKISRIILTEWPSGFRLAISYRFWSGKTTFSTLVDRTSVRRCSRKTVCHRRKPITSLKKANPRISYERTTHFMSEAGIYQKFIAFTHFSRHFPGHIL